ncbi:hypothetical protein A3D11_02775 [Candidatus Peribacteria bacterium RIFCSPHIGHO2_02_FULL_49_16]|nr:MAG: hypothetical protein A2880_01785 [Candidatus Peribacteria bacterium RIFCSPHIGHO2_01_FULL_49_38]OGJ58516.1 MAG: hypothetical protein A3D11_02775 [Candidatus Peribacteria bacterium RIFCSPHIGHO2_02_FULL_49_16]
MAVLAMQKVAILTHISQREQLIDILHEEGVMEIIEGVGEPSVEVNFRKAELDFAITLLKKFASQDALHALRPPFTVEQVTHAAFHTDVCGIIDRLHVLGEEDAQAEREIQQQHHLRSLLQLWQSLSYSLDEPRETETTILLFGMIPLKHILSWRKDIDTHCPQSDIHIVHEYAGVAYVYVIIWKADHALFEEHTKKWGWTSVELPQLPGNPRALVQETILKEKLFLRKKETHNEERRQLASELPNLLLAQMYMRWIDERHRARSSLDEGWGSVVLTGWVPRSRVAFLERTIQASAPATAILRLPIVKDEEPPVLLKNPRWITPFQSVTNLYGLPLSSEFDPTAMLAPFFALYFALCLTDAGYGLVLALLFGGVLLKLRKSPEEIPLLWLLFLGGIVTFLIGILFGGWFGLLPEQVPSVFTKQTIDGTVLFRGQIWNLGVESGITFLQNLSLVLGITHLFFGIFLAGLHKWIHGKRAAALWQDFTSHVLLGTVLFFVFAPESLTDVAQYTLYAAIALLVWGKGYGAVWYLRPFIGLLGVLNFAVSMLSNVLSYLRILALGLVTGALALAVNQLAIELGKLFPLFIAIPVIVVILLGGHLVSIALNTLGSFIHSGRLQFIEFFSQFFEGGGRAFSPFRRTLH